MDNDKKKIEKEKKIKESRESSKKEFSKFKKRHDVLSTAKANRD